MTDERSIEIGKRIRRYRKKAKLTQVELGKKAGLPSNTVARLERGEHIASSRTIEKLAKALSVTISDIQPV